MASFGPGIEFNQAEEIIMGRAKVESFTAEQLENEVRKAFDGFRGEIEGVCVDGVMLQNSSDTYNYELEIFEKETIYTLRINY